MKLASLADGTRDGLPVVVSGDLSRCTPATGIVATLRHALLAWDDVADRLRGLAARLEAGRERCVWRFHETHASAPVPEAIADGGDTVALTGARAPMILPEGSDRVNARLSLSGLVGGGRLRMLVPAVWVEKARAMDADPATVICGPVAVTADELDAAREDDQPLVARLWLTRDADTSEIMRGVAVPERPTRRLPPGHVGLAARGPAGDLGRVRLARGDRLRAGVTDVRRHMVAGAIDAAVEPLLQGLPPLSQTKPPPAGR